MDSNCHMDWMDSTQYCGSAQCDAGFPHRPPEVILQPGDLLFWRIDPGASWVDRLIGWGERRLHEPHSDTVNYYHVGIVGPDALHYYNSAPGGVKNNPIPNPWPSYIEVRRFIRLLDNIQLDKMWQYANSQIGTGYNYVGVLSAGLIEILGKPFCSELVWRILTYAGVVICPWETCLSPDDLAASVLIAPVPQ
jgi:hypothetical protein